MILESKKTDNQFQTMYLQNTTFIDVLPGCVETQANDKNNFSLLFLADFFHALSPVFAKSTENSMFLYLFILSVRQLQT